jgi:hypothetical protein
MRSFWPMKLMILGLLLLPAEVLAQGSSSGGGGAGGGG